MGVTTNETTSKIDAAVSAVLRAEAAAQKLTWPALAELSGVSKSTMSNYLNDVSAPKLSVLEDISEALGLDILEVIRRARERMSQQPVTIVTEAGVPLGGAGPRSGSERQPPRAQRH